MPVKKKKTPKKLMYAAFAALGLCFAGESMSDSSHEGSDVSRWQVKVLADDETSDINFKPENTTLHWLITQKTKPAKEKNPRQPIELKTYRIECRIDDFLYEDDGDVHLVLKSGNETMIGEIPFPYFPAAKESGFKTKFKNARKQFHKVVDNDPNYKYRTVIVTGVGFVDKPHGQTGKSDNNLELHPVLSIELKK
jgi:hypothetical protein